MGAVEATLHKLRVEACEFTGLQVGYCETCYSPDFDSEKYTDFTNWYGDAKDIAYEFYDHVLDS